jgi:hypothetical protein
MQSPFAKPLDRSFVDFFAKTGMQSPFAKLLELLTVQINNAGVIGASAEIDTTSIKEVVSPLNSRRSLFSVTASLLKRHYYLSARLQ